MELKKLPSELKTSEDVLAWMRFFSGKSREEFQTMAKTNEYLDEAYNTLLNLSADEKKRLEYEAREKALKDYNTQISTAEKRGLKAGEEIGRKDGIRMGKELGVQEARQVFKLYMQGRSPEEIADLCDISIDTVKQILE